MASTKVKSQQRVYVTADRKKAVPAGHPDAAFLLVPEGGEIHEKRIENVEGAAALMSKKGEVIKPPARPKRQEGNWVRSTATVKAKRREQKKAKSEEKSDDTAPKPKRKKKAAKK